MWIHEPSIQGLHHQCYASLPRETLKCKRATIQYKKPSSTSQDDVCTVIIQRNTCIVCKPARYWRWKAFLVRRVALSYLWSRWSLACQPSELPAKKSPGLYVYPKLLGNPLVHKGLIDMLLHHELADPRTRTNLHEKYHITYPEPLSPSGEANASFFDPVASQLKMQPRLEGSDNWTTSPITAREFVEKLRWFIIGDTSADGSRASMPPRIKALVENVVPIKTQTATAYLSSSQDSLELRQGQGEDGKFLDISLGCDGIFVLGLEGSGDEERETTSSVGQSDDDDSWRNLVVSPDSEDDGKAPAHQHAGEAGSNDKTVSSTRNAPRLAAIHLRSSDALLFTGPSKRAWYGVARILTGSSPTWEQQWPCWPGTIDSRRMEDWKGCMKGRRIDLVVR